MQFQENQSDMRFPEGALSGKRVQRVDFEIAAAAGNATPTAATTL